MLCNIVDAKCKQLCLYIPSFKVKLHIASVNYFLKLIIRVNLFNKVFYNVTVMTTSTGPYSAAVIGGAVGGVVVIVIIICAVVFLIIFIR